MLSIAHVEALAHTEQYDLGVDLLSRLKNVDSYTERLDILEQAEEQFGQLEVRAHAIRVAEAASQLATHCGFDHSFANRLYNATRLHDIGKLFMPTSILEKSGRPTEDEFVVIRDHAKHGGDLLGPGAPDFVRNVARYHHERYDGKGYNNLVGEDIPMEARLVQIADVYDALRSKRSYKPGLSEEATLVSMVGMQGYGVMFDPYLLRRFVEMRLSVDHDRSISPDAIANLSAFVKSHPMKDIEKIADKSVLSGWNIEADGTRIRKSFDHDSGSSVEVDRKNRLGAADTAVEADIHATQAPSARRVSVSSPRF